MKKKLNLKLKYLLLLCGLHERLRLRGVPLRLRFDTSLRASEPLSDILLTSESDIFFFFEFFFVSTQDFFLYSKQNNSISQSIYDVNANYVKEEVRNFFVVVNKLIVRFNQNFQFVIVILVCFLIFSQ